MRLILDIIRTPDGRLEGHITVPAAPSRQEFAGMLELLAVLEEVLDSQPDQKPNFADEDPSP